MEEIFRNKLLKIISGMLGGTSVSWSTYSRRNLTETYVSNPYVYAIIEKIAQYHGNLRYMVVRDLPDGTIEEQETGLAELMEYPNSFQGKKEFFDSLIRYYFIYGEAFIYGTKLEAGNNRGQLDYDGLALANPELVDIKHFAGVPVEYRIGNQWPSIPAENMIHLKNFNPKWEDAHGLPFIRAAMRIIDKLNAADEVEVKNFQNGGPAWIASAKEDGSFDAEQYTSLMDRLKALWKSPKNKGGLVGTSAQLELTHVGKTPLDMGTIESTKEALKMLCAVFGLDAGLFITDASTYNNKQLIEKAIYTGVIIPFAERFADKMTTWLGEAYGDVRVEVDSTGVEALQSNKSEMVNWMTMANAFTPNEIREAVSYDRIDEAYMDEAPGAALTGFGDTDREVMEVSDGSLDVQGTALNGAQISSLLEVINSISTGQIPVETGRAVLEAAFPTMPSELVTRIIEKLKGFKPEPIE
jgi:HK97 family phage portal protein